MDNLCLIGLGLFGLLFLTSKKEKKEIEIKKKDENVFIDFNNDKTSVTMEFMSNKYRNELEWIVPVDEVNNHPLHPFAGFDYMKLTTDINDPPVFGRYMKISESLKNLLINLEPTVNIINTIEHNTYGTLSLVTCSNKFPTISAITLNFAENINNEDLSICKMKNIYKKIVKNYTCKKVIEPAIEWYNQSLWDDNSYLHQNLCGDGDTSTLETNQIMDTEVLDDSATSDLEDDSDITSMDNQTELEQFVDSDTSEDENLAENLDENNSMSKSDNIILSVTSDDNSSNLDIISATSYDDTEVYNLNKPKCSKKKCAKKTENDKAKKSKTKKSKTKKSKTKKSKAKKSKTKKSKAKKSKTKKSEKINIPDNSDLVGGSSSLTNTRKSILGRV